MNPLQNTYHGLLINNRIYPIDELSEYCQNKIQTLGVPEWEKNIYKFILDWLDDKDFIVQNSSGTTGIYKELHLSKKSMIQSAQHTCDLFDIQFGNSAAFCLPIEYIAGKMMVVRALVAGLNLLIIEPSSMPDLSGYGKIDFCAMVPLQLYNSLNSVEAIRNIKKLIVGGAEIRPELEVILHDMPNEVYATYGMAETCSHVAIRRLSGNKFERYYTAMPGVSFNADDRNCLSITADYLDKEVFTNDVVDLIDSRTFRWIGRYDNLINSGGVKIIPEEVETLISKNTGLDCALIGLPDEKLGQKLILVLEKGKSDITCDEIRNLLKDELPKHAQPKDIVIVEQLPRNSSFKVDRRKLTSQLMSSDRCS